MKRCVWWNLPVVKWSGCIRLNSGNTTMYRVDGVYGLHYDYYTTRLILTLSHPWNISVYWIDYWMLFMYMTSQCKMGEKGHHKKKIKKTSEAAKYIRRIYIQCPSAEPLEA